MRGLGGAPVAARQPRLVHVVCDPCFESLDRDTLQTMNKGLNLMQGGPAEAIANFQRHGLRLYGTFVFGYDDDTAETFRATLEFAKEMGLFIAAFNHITPFPGTPLYDRMAAEGRLTYQPWWLDERYRYNMIPFEPATMPADELAARCLTYCHAQQPLAGRGSPGRKQQGLQEQTGEDPQQHQDQRQDHRSELQQPQPES